MTAPGRRRASVRPARRPAAGPLLAAGAALAAALLVALVPGGAGQTRGQASEPPPGAAAGATGDGSLAVPVDRATLVCPDATAPLEGPGQVLLGSLPGPSTGGSVRTGRLPGAAERERGLPVGGLERFNSRGGLLVAAEGPVAAGVFGARVQATGNALAATACVAPAARWWFTGAGADLDHEAVLTLHNVDAGPAVVDVTVLGADGPVDTVGTRGLTLVPGESTVLPLVELAPQGERLAVEVDAGRGRVVAAVTDAYAERPGRPPGAEWLPAHAAPSRTVRLAGLPQRAEARTLLVANPSARQALVRVQVAGEAGSFVPTEGGTLQVPPGSVAAVDLVGAVAEGAWAVVLRSTVPVTGTVRSLRAGDTAYTPVAQPLTGTAAVPVAGAALPDAGSTLLLTAGDQGGAADVTVHDRSGAVVTERGLAVPPGGTVAWRVRGGDAAYLSVEPREGRVWGAVAVEGAGVSALPLSVAPQELTRPVVVPVLR